MSSGHTSRGAVATKYHNEEWLGSETPVSVSCRVGDVCGFRLSLQRRTPSLMRDSSCGVNPALRCTNQEHSPRNTSSRSPAKICGRPKRSRVKNLPMQGRGVFYHVPGRFWQLYSGSSILESSAMDEPKESLTPQANDDPHPLHGEIVSP